MVFHRVAFAGLLCFVVLAGSAQAGQGETTNNVLPKTKSPSPLPERTLPELVTDRPDFTESTETPGTGVVPVEMGSTFQKEGSSGSFTQPEMLVRTGLSKNTELRIAHSGYLAEQDEAKHWRRGYADAELGFKIKLREQSRFLPTFSLIPSLSFPTGSRAFSSGGYDPTLKIALAKDLIAGFTVGGNLNYQSVRGETSRFLQQAYSVSVGHALRSGFEGYWEVYTFSPWDEGTKTAWIVNSGLTHGVGSNAQLDVRAGKRMTEVGPSWFMGVGFAFRQPTKLFLR